MCSVFFKLPISGHFGHDYLFSYIIFINDSCMNYDSSWVNYNPIKIRLFQTEHCPQKKIEGGGGGSIFRAIIINSSTSWIVACNEWIDWLYSAAGTNDLFLFFWLKPSNFIGPEGESSIYFPMLTCIVIVFR